MFYLKKKVKIAVAVSVEPDLDHVYCSCPKCGREVKINIWELLRTGDNDCKTSDFCDYCGKENGYGKSV